MKRFANALSIFACVAFPGLAAADHIGVYNDDMGTQCYLEITPPTVVSVYIVHIYTLGARGSTFKVDDQTLMVPLAEVPLDGALVIGSVYTGAEVAYPACYYGHFAPIRLDLYALNPVDPNCGTKLRIGAYPGDFAPMALDCTLVEKAATGGEFAFGPWYCTGCSANATEESTWGAVKALYR